MLSKFDERNHAVEHLFPAFPRIIMNFIDFTYIIILFYKIKDANCKADLCIIYEHKSMYKSFLSTDHLKLTTFKGLSKFPTSRHDIGADECESIASGDFKGEALAIEVGVALPILAPVS